MLPTLYRTLTRAAAPLVLLYLKLRQRQGKEDHTRLGERLGIASQSRPRLPLVWVHTASVGEATSVLALVEHVLRQRPGIEVLITTGTVAAARLLDTRLPLGGRHQFVPVDLPRAVDRFLDHWRPDLALWVESELWPNLVLATHRRGTPMVLVNARISARSHARWRAWPSLARPLMSAFALCLAQDEMQAARFRQLGAARVASVGDLKAAAEPLPVEPAALDQLRRQIDRRPLWLAASTHPREEEIVADAHGRIARDHPGLLTIIVPRHPMRGAAIAALIRSHHLTIARRAEGGTIARDVDIYVADTLGELGLFYRLSGIAFIGGSLVAKGGHNPFEAARLDCAVLHGPHTANCAAMTRALATAGAAEVVRDADSLARAVSALLADPHTRTARAAAGRSAAALGVGTLFAVLERLGPWLDRLAPFAAGDAAPGYQLHPLAASRANARSRILE